MRDRLKLELAELQVSACVKCVCIIKTSAKSIYIYIYWDVFLTIIATSTLQLDGAGDDVVKFILTGN